MKKKEELIKKLTPIIGNKEKLEKFIIKNSHLPGPRGNLELAFALADIYDDLATLLKWAKISEDQADVNNPKSFLAFCSAVCLGKFHTKKKNKKIIPSLKKLANDRRWRIREAAAFGFQNIGEHDFNELKTIFSNWLKKSNNLEKRAMLVSLAHPPFLNKENTKYCFKITDLVLRQMDRKNDFDILKKGLEFTISVFVAAHPKLGFRFIRKWCGQDKIIDGIMKKNLQKKRLIKKYNRETKNLLTKLSP